MLCAVTDIPYLVVLPTVELIGPEDSMIATAMNFTLTHTLDPVRTSHAGQYICSASIIIASVSVNVSSQIVTILTVQSKSDYKHLLMYVCYISTMTELIVTPPLVPQPGVDVTLSRSDPLYAGTDLTLTCTVTLDPNVDNGERVITEWSGLQDIQEERYSVTGASGSGNTYTDSLTISPLADQDDGTYSCMVTVSGGSNVLQATASAATNSIIVAGRFKTCQCMLKTVSVNLHSSSSSSGVHISS